MNQKSSKNPFSKDQIKLRSNYQAHSQKFKDWVDNLGLEQTFIGRFAETLDTRFKMRVVSFLFLYCMLLSFLLFFDFDFQPDVVTGRTAVSDLKSPISFVMVDEVATSKKRTEAENNILPVFDYDSKAFKGVTEPVYVSFREMRALIKKITWPKSKFAQVEVEKEFLINKPKFEELFGRKISNQQFEWLVQNKFNVHIENIIKNALTVWTSDPILDIPYNLIPADQKQIALLKIDPAFLATREEVIDINMLKDIKDDLAFTTKNIEGLGRFSKADQKILMSLARTLLFANVTYNKTETLSRRQKASESVLPVQISIKKNQTIVNQGTVVQPIHVTIFNEIQKRKAERRTDFISLMTALSFACFILVFFSYTRRFTLNRVRVEPKDLLVMGVVILVSVLIVKIFLFVIDAALVSRFGLPPLVLLFAAPVAAAPMIVGMLIVSGEVVWLFTVFLSIVLTVMVDMNFVFFLMCLVGSVAAVRGVHNTEKRNDIYYAGLRVGLINALTILFLTSLTKFGSQDLTEELIWYVPAGFLGGLFSSMVTMTLIPIIESVFNYTTDIKLLELSNLSHPLMKEMVVRAPGTYHHSLVVGSMVEAASKQIGANALLAKVMAYYHDIGKMDHAQYFIENQRAGFNPHDHVSPYMSKTILIAHVKDGAELGLKYKLGKPIIDGILQHHGTTLISYFYNKAIEEQDVELGEVDENDFRYPGPKPQFKEAALVMLADSIEAAARSLDDPTPARLQNIVQSIIQNKFLDGQLSDCDLTLQDLSFIEQSFEHVILAMYHQRIEYPGTSSTMNKKNVTNIKPKIGS